MKVTLDFESMVCTAQKTEKDPVFRDGSWGNAESRLLYHVQRELKKQGFDLIKKRMWKDGHMVDDLQQYLRTRKYMTTPAQTPGEFCIHDSFWAIRNSAEEFNRLGTIELAIDD